MDPLATAIASKIASQILGRVVGDVRTSSDGGILRDLSAHADRQTVTAVRAALTYLRRDEVGDARRVLIDQGAGQDCAPVVALLLAACGFRLGKEFYEEAFDAMLEALRFNPALFGWTGSATSSVDLVEVAGARSPSLKRIGDKQLEGMEERATELVTSAGDALPSLASSVQWYGRWRNPSHLEWMRASNQKVAGEGSSGFVEKMDSTYDNERVAPAPPKRSWLRLGDEQPTSVSVRAAGITQNSLFGAAGYLAVLFYPTSPTGSPNTPAPSILAVHDLARGALRWARWMQNAGSFLLVAPGGIVTAEVSGGSISHFHVWDPLSGSLLRHFKPTVFREMYWPGLDERAVLSYGAPLSKSLADTTHALFPHHPPSPPPEAYGEITFVHKTLCDSLSDGLIIVVSNRASSGGGMWHSEGGRVVALSSLR